ncbi:MAG: AcrR family transcriptional regulator [Pseudomonadales bacterium]|jgi:AcrR family transcriptional regulator
MKTKDKILATSLLLFNDEGEPNVTTVDIAHELDISPGNLYYHFKGKEAIIDSLYARFDVEITDILRAPLEKDLSVEDSWFYLYVVFERIYSFRFLYENLTDILQRYEPINKKFRRLLDLKAKTTETIIDALVDADVLDMEPEDIASVCETITVTLTYWITYRQLRTKTENEMILFHEGVFQIVHAIAPYLTPQYKHIYLESRQLYSAAITQLEN